MSTRFGTHFGGGSDFETFLMNRQIFQIKHELFFTIEIEFNRIFNWRWIFTSQIYTQNVNFSHTHTRTLQRSLPFDVKKSGRELISAMMKIHQQKLGQIQFSRSTVFSPNFFFRKSTSSLVWLSSEWASYKNKENRALAKIVKFGDGPLQNVVKEYATKKIRAYLLSA